MLTTKAARVTAVSCGQRAPNSISVKAQCSHLLTLRCLATTKTYSWASLIIVGVIRLACTLHVCGIGSLGCMGIDVRQYMGLHALIFLGDCRRVERRRKQLSQGTYARIRQALWELDGEYQ